MPDSRSLSDQATSDDIGWAMVVLGRTIGAFASDEHAAKVKRVCVALQGGDRLRAENELLREEHHRAINYLQCVRMCCGYTVPGGEFDVEHDELEGVMRAVGEFIDSLGSPLASDETNLATEET